MKTKQYSGLEKPCHFQIGQRITGGDAGWSFVPLPLPLPHTSSCFLCPKDLPTVLVSVQLFSFPVPSTHPDPLSSAYWDFHLGAFQGLSVSMFTTHTNLFPSSYPPSLSGCYHHPVTGPAQRNHLFSFPPPSLHPVRSITPQMERSLTKSKYYLNLILNSTLT